MSAIKTNNTSAKAQDLDINTQTVSQEELSWFLKVQSRLNNFSPLHPVFLMSNDPNLKLKDEISKNLLLNKLPKQITNETASIINLQFGSECEYWVQLFNHHLRLTPTFLFYSDSTSPEYLDENTRNFWNFLYVPQQEQYSAFLQDIIICNYSPFTISTELFKK